MPRYSGDSQGKMASVVLSRGLLQIPNRNGQRLGPRTFLAGTFAECFQDEPLSSR